MTDAATESGGGDAVAEVIKFSADGVSQAPVLGYRLRVSHSVSSDSEQRVPMMQRWIVKTSSAVTIDVHLFHRCRPFDELLGDRVSTSEVVPSAAAELADNWTIPEEIRAQLQPEPAGMAVLVCGTNFKALVWADGMLISAVGPVATGLKLLIANFSPEARSENVKAEPDILKEALDVFLPEVRNQYISHENDYMAQAYHEVFEERQAKLRRRRPNVVLYPEAGRTKK